MSLTDYRTKRNFKKTPEPGAKRSNGHREPLFVVQEHHASRLHYDFRLEYDGVLKSWAVTKEPSLDPSVRRLAVEVEDHPVAYAKFSGDIPQGEYGAGHVDIWDNGTWQVTDGEHVPKNPAEVIEEGLRKGHLTFRLEGERLKGGFALIRMDSEVGKKANWLLIKMKDRFAEENGEDRKEKEGKSRVWHRPDEPKGSASARRSGKVPDEIELTNTDRVMFPKQGITKGDLLDYYDRIADRLLPHLQNRPMTLERLPDGLSGKKASHFWQKNTPDYYPDWIPRVTLETTEGKEIDYVLVNDRATLLYLVNQGTVTFHPWMSRIRSLNNPDYVLFDLDPGKKRPFADVVTVAKRLHDYLEEREIPSWVKTSGKSGLHVLVSWRGKKGRSRGDYDAARLWGVEVAAAVAGELSDIATTERSIDEREGRLYLDVLQNVRGHHAVPPYVVRATPEATVSTPLRWEELSGNLDPKKYTVKTIFRRLGQLKEDPIEGLVVK